MDMLCKTILGWLQRLEAVLLPLLEFLLGHNLIVCWKKMGRDQPLIIKFYFSPISPLLLSDQLSVARNVLVLCAVCLLAQVCVGRCPGLPSFSVSSDNAEKMIDDRQQAAYWYKSSSSSTGALSLFCHVRKSIYFFLFYLFIYLLQLWWGIKTYFIQRGAQALYQQWQKVVILPWIISLRQSFCKWVGCFSEQGQQTRSVLLPPHLWLPAMVQTDRQNYNLFTTVKTPLKILAKQRLQWRICHDIELCQVLCDANTYTWCCKHISVFFTHPADIKQHYPSLIILFVVPKTVVPLMTTWGSRHESAPADSHIKMSNKRGNKCVYSLV